MTMSLLPPVDDGLWTMKQASSWLSVSEHALRTMLRRNQVPLETIVRMGRRIRFRSDLIRAWVKGGCPA